jgi:hypothetical protein
MKVQYVGTAPIRYGARIIRTGDIVEGTPSKNFLCVDSVHRQVVCVVGQSRGGTSLMCDLVQSAGYDFGSVRPVNLRDGRNELPAMQHAENLSNLPPHKGIKISTRYDHWIPLFRDRALFVFILRDSASVERSRRAYHSMDPLSCERSFIEKERALIESHIQEGDTVLHFTDVLRGSLSVLEERIGKVDRSLIRPEIVENEG